MLQQRYYIGLLSGTSMDAIDAALVELDPFQILATYTAPLPPALRQQLSTLIESSKISLKDLGSLDTYLSRLFAEAVLMVLAEAKISAAEVRAIGSHGQTIYHWAQEPYPFTLQLADPNIIAEMTGITTVADFRRRDLAAGGQGAPLTPAFHAAFLRNPSHNQAVLNIGGIANISFLPADSKKQIQGFDTGPGNTLMDNWALRYLNEPMDQGGHWAASGKVNETLLQYLLSDPYFSLPPPKSTGREYFNMTWLDQALNKIDIIIPPVDIQATLSALTVASVKLAMEHFNFQAEKLLICGGGASNETLMRHLQEQLTPCEVTTTEAYGIPTRWVEACTFAWLAKQTLEGCPGNIPAVTGAKHPVILGAIYPANTFANSCV
ncbi:anhydro-N-acetylmuramic acid kinase [Candidatus Nitrosoglobus terrae]|uniref:Anhydro-N-acetylmuramic acid kinase n=1 Tax=Candidatus Nitrosoglobus terrae TaxID=1630141 RepID=A0A1Q2SNU5_9GAMM|nr:anhydro-N-acetylmuramic acid kinase [Candidatus Nitrosoglobus terrae]BAW80773.1 anhydro-N-acetylmuramic acid kinase [Candidatus Nitrosoglobus terrae]